MGTKFKLLFIVTIMLLALAIATIVNVSLNFREYSIKGATEKATMTAAIVKDGLTAHMVNDMMDKRQYFLDQISNNHSEVKSLWIVRSPQVTKQYGAGFQSETLRDDIDKEVLQSGKIVQTIQEGTDSIILRVSVPYVATTSQPNCLQCHNVQRGETLGAISMEFDITNMRNAGMVTILKILAINLGFIVIVLFLLNHYVSPYMKLFSSMQEGITKAYSGDFTHKFFTNVKGDARHIAEQLNTLFSKMQETFGNIKYNLSTFIPQGCVASKDPLQEAKSIIGELSDIYKFKKTIELDIDKETVYKRIIDALEYKFDIHEFAFYQVNQSSHERKLIYSSTDKAMCSDHVNHNANLCRAFRTQSDVISTEYIDLCQACHKQDGFYVCIPFSINDEYSIVLNIAAKNESEVSQINAMTPSIKNYFEAAKPVIESRILTAKLRDTSLRDGMTGLYNRRFLEEFIDQVISQANRKDETYTVLMLDVDFFKMVNDTYGHDLGDKVIVELANVLKKSIREADLAIRYGGEEFLILLHNATSEGALNVAQKIHQSFAALTFEVGMGETMKKTISIGIAKYPSDADSIWKTIKFADTALYEAKNTGRNKIVEFQADMFKGEDF
ncbi:GGDEF domain-containing protein [Sulfurimonas marina]|uniref:diguanylate cyclase n=1 Tax=Sulfurimonas marina TaxID=2590551 RepID=A0A7M1AU06_9BACT|nr:GGDEF domain-containing protein [Sulfurimonas marina]QOP40866.1 GGDEF domain-containing protein [Sulfurimonas marina]